jgi:hypothetical protein
MTEHKRVTELAFGLEILKWSDRGVYPLEMVSSIEFTDSEGIFYAPCIEVYAGIGGAEKPETVITGSGDGYETRQELLSCVGHCWDLAIEHFKK